MRSSPLSGHKNVRSLLRFTFLGLLLIIALGCNRMPNLIPFGYEGVFDKDAARASTAARVDYPIVLSLDPADTSITFVVSKNGERVWFWNDSFWDQPFWKSVTWYRITLIEPGGPSAICLTAFTKPNGDMTKVPCTLNNKAVKDYLAKPLVATLDYWVGGDESNPPGENDLPTGGVPRLYYFIPVH